MEQELIGGPGTYSRMKDIQTGNISEPKTLSNVTDDTMYARFMDDDFGGARTFEAMVTFLHRHYFPRLIWARLTWARLTINPNKSRFFVDKLRILGFQRDKNGIRPSLDKLAVIRDWPTPTDEKTLMIFLLMLPYLRAIIPERANLARIMKEAMVEEVSIYKNKGKKRTTKAIVGFEWGTQQQEAFEATKYNILTRCVTAGSSDRQYHLATDASKTGLGGCLATAFRTRNRQTRPK